MAWHGARKTQAMTNRSLLLSALLSTALFACASNPNKDAEDAHDAQLKSERKQQENAADNRSDARVTAAEVKQENTAASATGTPAMQKSTAADAKMTEARSVARAKATERLEKADARSKELKALVDKAGPKAPTSARDSLQTVATQRSMVANELGRLPTVTDDQFDNAKNNLSLQLDTLENLVKKAGDEVDKIKK
jgi:hypothetical protein